MPRSRKGTIFLFTHSNRIKCLLKKSFVNIGSGNDYSSMSIKQTLEKHKENQKTFKKYFNNITFHIKKSSSQYKITVLDAGSIRSTENKIGNEDLSYYRSGTIDSPVIDYLTIVEGPLTEQLRNNEIKSIVISRHGHGRHNDNYRLAISDARLTDKGERDTEATAQRVKRIIDNLTPIHTVFTSELFRTMQTAALFMKELGYVGGTTHRTFYIVRCNHELSSAQEEEGKCNSSIDTIINSKKSMFDEVKYRLRMGDENYPKRLENKIKSFCAQNNKCNGMDLIELTPEELNCSTRNYTESCHKKDNMFDNIGIVFYRNQEKDCNNYSLFRNIKDIISRSTSKGYVGRSVEVQAWGGTIRKSIKRNKKKKTLRKKSKRRTKKRNIRKTKKKRFSNKRRTSKKRFTKRR